MRMLLRACRHSSRLALSSISAGRPPWEGAPITIVLAPMALAYSATIRPATPWPGACRRTWPWAGTWWAASRSSCFLTTVRASARSSPSAALSPVVTSSWAWTTYTARRSAEASRAAVSVTRAALGEPSTAARIMPAAFSGAIVFPVTGTRAGAAGAVAVTGSAWTRSASVSRPRAVDKMAMPSTMAPAAMKNGTWMFRARTSRPAA